MARDSCLKLKLKVQRLTPHCVFEVRGKYLKECNAKAFLNRIWLSWSVLDRAEFGKNRLKTSKEKVARF
jgi:hypothetical protein